MASPRFFESAGAFRAWLVKNAATASELLVGYHKVATGRSSMSWSESVDEALCFGWIDGVRKRIDDDTYSIRFTPRKCDIHLERRQHWQGRTVACPWSNDTPG